MPQTSTHSYTDAGGYYLTANLHIRSSWGFSVLLKDTSTLAEEESGLNLPIAKRLLYHWATIAPVCRAWVMLHQPLSLLVAHMEAGGT